MWYLVYVSGGLKQKLQNIFIVYSGGSIILAIFRQKLHEVETKIYRGP